MFYSEVQPIALAIQTSIITGGFVLVFVEIGNKKHRDNDRHEQIMAPFMHKLSAYFRFLSWCSHNIVCPKSAGDYDKSFKDLVSSLGEYGGRIIVSGGDYLIGNFTAKELEHIALDINNVWYYHDKMNPCMLLWENTEFNDDIINKELKHVYVYISLFSMLS